MEGDGKLKKAESSSNTKRYFCSALSVIFDLVIEQRESEERTPESESCHLITVIERQRLSGAAVTTNWGEA